MISLLKRRVVFKGMSGTGGSNSLRGGKKKYGPKTKCGNWVELNKEPGQSLPSGYPHAMYKTDAQQQMLEGLLLRPKKYGAGLPPPIDPDIDYEHVINYDKRQGDAKWAAITRTEFVTPAEGMKKSKEFTSSFKPSGGIKDPAELKRYRDAWTVETDSVRAIRFESESVITANNGVPSRFKMVQTRPVPGAPKAVERLRRKLQENSNGKNDKGLVNLRRVLTTAAGQPSETAITGGDSSVRKAEFVEGLQRVGVTYDSADVDRAFSFFSEQNSEGTVGVNALLRGLRGVMDVCRRRAVSEAFQGLDESGSGVIRVDDLKQRLDAYRVKQDIEDPGSNLITANDLDILHQSVDLYAEGDALTRVGLEDFLGEAFFSTENDDTVTAIVKSVLKKQD